MIRIITDSTADIPREDIQALGVRVVPLQVNIDGEMFRDGLDLEPESFYEMLAGAPHARQAPVCLRGGCLRWNR